MKAAGYLLFDRAVAERIVKTRPKADRNNRPGRKPKKRQSPQ